MNRKVHIQNQIDSLLKELDRLNRLPDEPMTDPGPTVIQWDTDFGNPHGQVYSYAAINTPAGWYTTGPRGPKGISWTSLIQWITTSAVPISDVWVATEWEVL